MDQFLLWLWIPIILFWVVSGGTTKRTAQSRSEGLSRIAVWIVWIAWWLLFTRGARIPFLSRTFAEASPTVSVVGFLLTVVGLGFALWARLYIGRNWSGLIELKEGHQLIRTGPYAIVRHPIYSGFMLATLGTAIAYRVVGGLISFVMIVLAWGYKARLEEVALREYFGPDYDLYAQSVKGLIPFVW
jgi:protein-S-isoprenylcysteine O-methyltransferase Ste14